MSSSNEKEFRLRPRKPPRPRRQDDALVWALAFKRIMHYARMTGKRAASTFGVAAIRSSLPGSQRCAVRVTYSRNTAKGQWRAHGRYLARESATLDTVSRGIGFDRTTREIEIAPRVDEWQTAGDQRLWKLILSPEFGERMNLECLTRDVMSRMEQDLESGLEWVAVAHYNTEHPHVHIALRGIRDDGHPLRLNREYIRQGIRGIAEDFCTRQLGHRTQLDAAEAERREIAEKRYTSLDRAIWRNANADEIDGWLSITTGIGARADNIGNAARVRHQHIAARLAVLKNMGLAQDTGTGHWIVRPDFEEVLRAMQRAGDRQKMLARHGALVSDERLPIQMLDLQRLTEIEGRVLVHGEDEKSGRSYMMLEGVDARIHFIYYTRELEIARKRGGLRTNSLIRLRKVLAAGRALLEVDELGNSEALLKNARFLDETARELRGRGIIPAEDGWGGWLGRYQAAICRASVETTQPSPTDKPPERTRGPERGRGRSRGR